MKMGEGGAFIVGGLVGGAVTAGPAYKAGYNKRDAELQPIISSLQNQVNVKDRQLAEKDRKIAELQIQLDDKTAVPVISQIRKKLRGSQS